MDLLKNKDTSEDYDSLYGHELMIRAEQFMFSDVIGKIHTLNLTLRLDLFNWDSFKEHQVSASDQLIIETLFQFIDSTEEYSK